MIYDLGPSKNKFRKIYLVKQCKRTRNYKMERVK